MRHAGEACRLGMQVRHEGEACRLGMQVRHAGEACRYQHDFKNITIKRYNCFKVCYKVKVY